MQIVAANLSCERGGRLAFSNLDFAVAAGEFLQLTGPNGAGKSSLLRIIANLGDISSGHIELHNGDSDLTLAQQSHYIAHADAAKTALTVTENLQFWGDFLGGDNIAGALGSLNLQTLADYPVALLSAGQKRRLALARLSLVPRKIWLLDEPSVGLDEASQGLLVGLMQQHLNAGGLIIAATHVPLGVEPDRNLILQGKS